MKYIKITRTTEDETPKQRRERIAETVFGAMYMNTHIINTPHEDYARVAVAAADALIKELDK